LPPFPGFLVIHHVLFHFSTNPYRLPPIRSPILVLSQREVTPYPPSLPITLDSVVRFLKKTIFSPRFAMNIQAGFFLWRKFAPAGWKDRFDLDGHVELQFWLKRYGYAIATLCKPCCADHRTRAAAHRKPGTVV